MTEVHCPQAVQEKDTEEFSKIPRSHLVLGAQVVPFLGDLVGGQLPLEAQALQDGAGGRHTVGCSLGSVLLES